MRSEGTVGAIENLQQCTVVSSLTTFNQNNQLKHLKHVNHRLAPFVVVY